MAYLHIDNLYKNRTILLFRRCYELEKIHGTSAHIEYKDGTIVYFSGGEKHSNFVALFSEEELKEKFTKLGHPKITIYGEAYGGKCQGMKHTYGDQLRFIVFDVKIGDYWLDVPNMDQVATSLGLEVVPWSEISTDLVELDRVRDQPSRVGIRRGCPDKISEGVVLRSLIELTTNNGERIICKHKTEKFSEHTRQPKVTDNIEILTEANAIADQWCTPNRLQHILDKMESNIGMEKTAEVIKAMVADIYREGKGEIVEGKEVAAAIGRKTAQLFKAKVKEIK